MLRHGSMMRVHGVLEHALQGSHGVYKVQCFRSTFEPCQQCWMPRRAAVAAVRLVASGNARIRVSNVLEVV